MSSFSFSKAKKFILWGAALLLTVWLAALLAPRPAVGIIRLDTDIWSGSAAFVGSQMEAARRDRRIKAVVVQIDSPGGEVVASQTLYLELQNLRREMPVVGSIDNMAASGAYYTALATDPIYAKPSSSVGNVGVWARVPPEPSISEELLTSGPFKLTGSNRAEFTRQIERIKQEFLATVSSQRGDRLKLSPAEISQGLLYPGSEAVRLGLIDYVGGQSEAVATAASQAGITHYAVVDLEARASKGLLGIDFPVVASPTTTAATGWDTEPEAGAVDPETEERFLPYGIYLLYNAQLGGTP